MMRKLKSRKNITGKIFGIVSILVSFGIILTMADLFSSLITVGGFSFASENISYQEYKVYAVYTSKHQEIVIAKEISDTIKKQGGAGYIYLQDDFYYIIAGIYEAEADGQKVLENIIPSKPDAGVICITISHINISSNLTQQEKTTLNNSLGIFKSTYKKLYDISVSLDTAVINEVNARLSLNELASNVQTTIGNFNTIFANNMSTALLKIKLGIEDTLSYLNALIDNIDSIPFTSIVKECYCKVLICYQNLANSL